jgi:hypothetical protein
MMENASINGLKLGYPQFRKARNSRISRDVMWEKQCHKPLMTGNGKFIPPIKMVMTGGWFMTLFYQHYQHLPHIDHQFLYTSTMEDRSGDSSKYIVYGKG